MYFFTLVNLFIVCKNVRVYSYRTLRNVTVSSESTFYKKIFWEFPTALLRNQKTDKNWRYVNFIFVEVCSTLTTIKYNMINQFIKVRSESFYACNYLSFLLVYKLNYLPSSQLLTYNNRLHGDNYVRLFYKDISKTIKCYSKGFTCILNL